jgi:hypothetical protein
VTATSPSWPVGEHLADHARWRPEWQPGRVCLCWYLVFGGDLLTVLDPAGLRAVRRADWLDAVPARWLHVTLGDVGYADELGPADVQSVLEAARPRVAATRHLHLGFGEAASMEDTVALPVEPFEPVHHLQRRLCSVTQRTLGPRHQAHLHLYPPHLSLGYANRRVSALEAGAVIGQIGRASGAITVDRLVLAAVTRQRTHYEWAVLDELPFSPETAAAS